MTLNNPIKTEEIKEIDFHIMTMYDNARNNNLIYKGLVFQCLGCGKEHIVMIEHPYVPRDIFNNDYHNPTMTQPILLTEDDGMPKGERCHYVIEYGYLEYFFDCTHNLANKRIKVVYKPEADRVAYWFG